MLAEREFSLEARFHSARIANNLKVTNPLFSNLKRRGIMVFVRDNKYCVPVFGFQGIRPSEFIFYHQESRKEINPIISAP